jgi:hypothetical protein
MRLELGVEFAVAIAAAPAEEGGEPGQNTACFHM